MGRQESRGREGEIKALVVRNIALKRVAVRQLKS